MNISKNSVQQKQKKNTVQWTLMIKTQYLFIKIKELLYTILPELKRQMLII